MKIAHAVPGPVLEAHNDDREQHLRVVRGGQLGLTHAELEDLCRQLQAAPKGSPEAAQVAQALLLAVKGIIVTKAVRLVSKAEGVALADLVNVGCVEVLAELPKFKPGRAAGKSLLPGWTAKVAVRAMRRYLEASACPVTVSKHARQQHARARAVDPTLGALVMPAVGLDDAPEIATDVETAEDQLIEAQLQVLLPHAVQRLPQVQQQVLELTYGLGDRERLTDDRRIARRLGLTLDAVRTLRAEALATLRERLEG